MVVSESEQRLHCRDFNLSCGLFDFLCLIKPFAWTQESCTCIILFTIMTFTQQEVRSPKSPDNSCIPPHTSATLPTSHHRNVVLNAVVVTDEGCRGFLLTCNQYFCVFLEIMPTQKVSFMVWYLTDRAYEWAMAYLRTDLSQLSNFIKTSGAKYMVSLYREGSQFTYYTGYSAGSTPER